MRTILSWCGTALTAVFALFILAEWAIWAVWFVPVVATAVYFLKHDMPHSSLAFYHTLGAVGAANGLWVLLLTAFIGPRLPDTIQGILLIPGMPQEYGAPAGQELGGLIAFVTAGGLLLSGVTLAMQVTARISGADHLRRIAFGAAVSLLVSGTVVCLWQLGFVGTALIFGFIGGAFSVGSFWQEPRLLLLEMVATRQ